MATDNIQVGQQSVIKLKKKSTVRDIKKDRWVYILLLPGLFYFLIFKYIPMEP